MSNNAKPPVLATPAAQEIVQLGGSNTPSNSQSCPSEQDAAGAKSTVPTAISAANARLPQTYEAAKTGLASEAWKPKARWARKALRSAMNRGVIEPRPCEACGVRDVFAHQPDLNRPLDRQAALRQVRAVPERRDRPDRHAGACRCGGTPMMQASAYGRLGQDPRSIAMQSGKEMAVVTIAVAIDEPDAPSLWVGVVAFGRVAEDLLRHAKGDLISVSGRVQRSTWTTQAGEKREQLQIVADDIVSARTVRPSGGTRGAA